MGDSGFALTSFLHCLKDDSVGLRMELNLG